MEHEDVIKALNTAQEVDHDRREIMREVNLFCTKKDAQWERSVWGMFDTYGRPRYTIDKTRPIVAAIWGELADNEINIRVRPADMAASDDTAETYSGLIRSIEKRSNAEWVYAQAAKKAIQCGFSAFRVEQDWADINSFDQDLFIRPIHDALDRVWFLGNYQEQTGADADGVVIYHHVSEDEFKDEFDVNRSVKSLPKDRFQNSYFYTREGCLIGEYIYKKKVTETIYQAEDGSILSEEDAKERGIIDTARSRKRETHKICVRFFDGGGWLNDAEDTVFKYLPVIPVLPNFEITENKPLSIGAIEWLMDEQRILNYAVSRKVEETALAPKSKLMITEEQSAGREPTLATMNNNNDPAFVYRHEESQPPPYYPQPPSHNMGLSEVIGISKESIEESAGLFGPNLAKNEGNQSGVAIRRQQHKGDLGTIEFFKAIAVAVGHAGKVIVGALPEIYPEGRKARIIKEDGSVDEVQLYEYDPIEDVFYNDLSKGIYDVECDIGPAFASRREETAQALIGMAQVDPSMISMGKDILLNAQDAPGMKQLAERARMMLIRDGVIPEWQLKDEEKEQIAEAEAKAAENPPPPDPAMLIAQAEIKRVEAETAKVVADTENKKMTHQLELYKLQMAQNDKTFSQEKQRIELMSKQQQDQMDQQEQMINMIKGMAEALSSIQAATGAQPTPTGQQAYDNQTQNLVEVQEQM